MYKGFLAQFSIDFHKITYILFFLFSLIYFIIIHPQTIFAVTPPTPRGPHYLCDLQNGVARINWFRTNLATSYEFRLDAETRSWNDSCTDPNDGDICISTSETDVTVPIVPLVRYDWWVHAVNQDGYSPAMDGPNFRCDIPLPRLFHFACKNNNTEVELTWQASGSPERYEARLDAYPRSWNGSCESPNQGDQCGSTSTTKITLPIKQGVTYRSWVHSVQSDVWTTGIEGPQIRCGFLPSTTPTATRAPTPTRIPTNTPTSTPTNTPTNTPTPTPSNTPTPTPSPTITPTFTPRPTAIFTPTLTPIYTPIPASVSPTGGDGECLRHPEGDANCDDIIDVIDYACWKVEYVEGERGASCVRTADFDSQEGVSLLDFAIWQVNFVKDK